MNDPTDSKEKSEIGDAREKAKAWLAKNKPNDTTQAAALRLLFRVRAGESPKALQADIAQFLSLQKKDGGWSHRSQGGTPRHGGATAPGRSFGHRALAASASVRLRRHGPGIGDDRPRQRHADYRR